MLSGRYSRSAAFGPGDRRSLPRYANFHGAGLEKSMRVVAVLRACAEEMAVLPAQLAVAWVRRRFGRVLPIVGLKSRAQLRDALAGVRLEVPEDIAMRLDAASSQAG
jgi:aryl-alcohol dehydrogenase-like predicted oxidoreductase